MASPLPWRRGTIETISSCDQSPGRVPEVITVAASDSSDARAWFSSPGSCNDVFAPGVAVQSADYTSDSGSAIKSGTSMAAPHVAGAAALILQENPTYTPAQVWAAMAADATTGVITGKGTGDPDRLLHVTPQPRAPSAPTGVTAAVWPATGVGAGEVKLTWTAPADSGSEPITDYVVQSSLDGTTWTTVDDGVSTATTFTVSGLTGGTTYNFTVAAKSAVGVGTSSATVTATPASAPAAPTGLTAAVAPAAGLAAGQVQLSWSAPGSNGSAITDYVIQSTIDGTTWTTVNDGVSTTTGFKLTGLTGGTSYSFRVAATNALGTGPWSATVTATAVSEPAAPTGLTAAVAPAAGVGSGEVQLSWTAPAANGSAITDYVVQRSLDGTTWTAVDDGVSAATTAKVSGLTGGTPYQFRVAATNGLGTGPWSSAIAATPVATPGAPGGLTAAVAPTAGVGPGQVKIVLDRPDR